MPNMSGLDIWSVISGAIGVLTIVPLIYAFVWTQHPETKFAQLESTLKETEDLLRSVVEEGLLDPEHHVAHFELHLKKFRRKTEQFRDETYIASNEWRKLLGAWYNGLSKRISLLCEKVKSVRANISETSANARMQLMEHYRDEATPCRRAWSMNFSKFYRRIVSLVCPRTQAPAEISGVPVSTTPAMLPFDGVSPSATTASVSETPCTRSPSGPPSRKLSAQPLTFDFDRPSRRVSRTASKARDHHMLARALRRVDRKLTAQGVTNALLTQLVEATHKQWSPASSKAHSPRRSRKPHRPVCRPEHVPALQLEHASKPGMDSDMESSGEETMCEA